MTAVSITSRKYICYTLTLKHQLKLAYRIISLNILSSEIRYGNVINISNDIVNDIKRNLMNSPNIDLTSAKFVSWVEVKNIQYSLKNMTLIIDTYDMPLFVLIKFIYFLPDNNYPFLICNKFTTITFDEHVQAYEVKMDHHTMVCLNINNLIEQIPSTFHYMPNGKTYINQR